MEIINVVMIINELGSPKAAIALLQVVHFQPSIYQRHDSKLCKRAYPHWKCMEPDDTWQTVSQSMDSYNLL
jgi:hypothetical protein